MRSFFSEIRKRKGVIFGAAYRFSLASEVLGIMQKGFAGIQKLLDFVDVLTVARPRISGKQELDGLRMTTRLTHDRSKNTQIELKMHIKIVFEILKYFITLLSKQIGFQNRLADGIRMIT